MNINLNTIRQAGIPAMPQELAHVEQNRQATQPAALSITHAAASPEDVAVAEVPEQSLSRNDPLGQLVNSAFNLPPPPFPAVLAG